MGNENLINQPINRYQKLKEALNFLIKDFGFQIVSETEAIQEEYGYESKLNVVSYLCPKLHIEFAIFENTNMLHFDIRKVKDEVVAAYSDEVYCISKEELIRLTGDERMHSRYDIDIDQMLYYLVELLKNNLDVLLNDWLDPEKIRQKTEYITQNYRLKNYEDVFLPIMVENNYTLVKNNWPSYISYYLGGDFVKFSNGVKTIGISRHFDYREQSTDISLSIDGEYYGSCPDYMDFREFLRLYLYKIIKQ